MADATSDEKKAVPDDEANTRSSPKLSQVICICKGIPLGKVLKALPGCETVMDVNRKAGTGSGGCAGQRCGPRIKILLRKWRAMEQK